MADIRDLPEQSLTLEELKKFDKVSHAVTFIDEEHRLTHDGATYSFSTKIIDLPKNGIFRLLVVQKAGKAPAHIRRWRISPDSGPITARAFEGVITTNDGVPSAGRNQNRNFEDVHGLQFFSDPVVIDQGVRLVTQYIPTAASDPRQEDSFGQEWVLRFSETLDTKYLLKVENNANGKVTFGVSIFWYEPPYIAQGTKKPYEETV